MKIDGLDWLEWLHKSRRESEDERKCLGLSRAEWLKKMEDEAERIQDDLRAGAHPVTRDRPRS